MHLRVQLISEEQRKQVTSEEPKTVHSTKENCLKTLIGNSRDLREHYIHYKWNKIKAEAAMIGNIREQENSPQNQKY